MYQVWHNPLNGGVAYVADESGRYLGEAPVMVAARIDDREAIEKHLGLRQRAIAAESRGLRPYVAMRQAEAAETARHNAEVLLGRDPAEDAALKEAAGVAAARAGRVEVDDLVLADAPAGGASLDDIL